MALVDYSDSETSQPEETTVVQDQNQASLKRKRSIPILGDLPPLPDAFYDLYASTSRISTQDDPALHHGRHRAVPHLEGNWPTHVYIEWYPALAESSTLTSLIEKFNDGTSTGTASVHSLLQSDLGTEMPLHISLSRSITLKAEQRQPFLDTLTHLVEESGVSPFDVTVMGLKWVPNHEKTRWFLVLELVKPENNNLNKLLHLSNTTAKKFNQPTLYSAFVDGPSNYASRGGKQRNWRPRGYSHGKKVGDVPQIREPPNTPDCSSHFHVSIAWCLRPPSSESSDEPNIEVPSQERIMRLHVKAIKVKVGNIISSLPLSVKLLEPSKSILGSQI